MRESRAKYMAPGAREAVRSQVTSQLVPPHLHRDWAHPLPHLHRGGLGSPRRIGTGIGLHRYNETLRDLLSPDASLSMKLDTEAKVEVR